MRTAPGGSGCNFTGPVNATGPFFLVTKRKRAQDNRESGSWNSYPLTPGPPQPPQVSSLRRLLGRALSLTALYQRGDPRPGYSPRVNFMSAPAPRQGPTDGSRSRP